MLVLQVTMIKILMSPCYECGCADVPGTPAVVVRAAGAIEGVGATAASDRDVDGEDPCVDQILAGTPGQPPIPHPFHSIGIIVCPRRSCHTTVVLHGFQNVF